MRFRGAGRHRYSRPSHADVRAKMNAKRRVASTPSPAPEASPSSPADPHRTDQLPDLRPRRRSHGPSEGSLREASKWTALGSVVPGLGLLPTKFRPFGIAAIALFAITLVALGLFALFGSPVPTLITLGTKRWFLILVLALVVVAALAWTGIIALTNHEHNQKQRLQAAAKVASMALAYVFILGIALPATHAVHSLWAGQQLIGNQSVWGGDDGRIAKGPDPWKGTERINVMLLGQDAGADRTGTRPDTIMVASIDTKTGRTALFSIPRNLQYVEFPKGSAPAKEFPDGFDHYGHNQNLINAVWTWAEEVRPDLFPGDKNPGRTATTMAVEETLGLEIDYYAMVNLQGFQDLVNAIGGVDIEVERNIPIGGGNSKVEGYVKKGQQHLDGYQALWYARSRHGSSDFDRNCRQQRIVRTVTEEADVTSLVLAFPRLISATERNIETDIPSSRLDAFADLGLRIQKGGFKSYPINPSVTPSGNPDYPYLEKWVQASIADSMETAGPESVRGKDATPKPSAAPSSSAPSAPSASPVTSTSPSAEPSTSATSEEETTDATTEATTEATEKPSAKVKEKSQDPSEASEKKDEDESTVVVNKDPLAACMPGNDDPIN